MIPMGGKRGGDVKLSRVHTVGLKGIFAYGYEPLKADCEKIKYKMYIVYYKTPGDVRCTVIAGIIYAWENEFVPYVGI